MLAGRFVVLDPCPAPLTPPMHTGWFAVDRQLLSSDLWLAERFSRAQAWIDLLGLARFQPGHVRLQGKRIDLARGQLAWSQRSLAQRWRWSDGKVRSFLKELKRDEQIDYRSVGVTTVITLVCYDTQDSRDAPTCAPTDEHSAQSSTTKEERQPRKHRQPEGEWGEIESTLKELGVTAAGVAVQSARSRDLSPEIAQAWIEEFRAKLGAWGAGALVGRLTGKLTDWPPPNPDYLRDEARRRFTQSYERQAKERAERKARHQAEHAAEQGLEARLAPVLDGMTESDREKLEARAFPDPDERSFTRRYTSVFRNRLLARLGEELKLALKNP